MLEALIEVARARGDASVELSAQSRAAAFYRTQGFEPVGEPHEEAGIPHQKMRRSLLVFAAWAGAAVITAAGAPQARAGALDAVSNADAASALRGALERGAAQAVARLGKPGGFLDEPRVRIPLPDGLRQAEGLLRRATEILVRVHGTDHPSIARWLLKLGKTYLPYRPAQALLPLQRAQALAQKWFSDDETVQDDLLWSLALAYEHQQQVPEAIQCLRRLLQGEETSERHQESLKLASLLLRSEQFESATQLLQKMEVQLPVPPPIVEEQVKAWLGHLMIMAQRYEEAEPRLLEALQLRSERLGQHLELLTILRDLSELYAAKGQDAQLALFTQ